MKTLTRIFFSTFVIALFYSCEPEEIPANQEPEKTVFADTGDQEGEVVYKDKVGG